MEARSNNNENSSTENVRAAGAGTATGTGAQKQGKSKSTIYPSNLTVEQYLQQNCEKIIASLQDHAKQLVVKLKEEYAQLKEQLLHEKQRAVEQREKEEGEGSEITLEFSVEDGPYKGRQFQVTVAKDGKPAMVGRSRGVKFRNGGISLPRDGEVSTTHGKIEWAVNSSAEGTNIGMATFTDVGSTNGSMLNGESIEQNEPVPLTPNDTLLLGASVLKVLSCSQ